MQLWHQFSVMQLKRLPADAQVLIFAGAVVQAVVPVPHHCPRMVVPTSERSASVPDNSYAPPDAFGSKASARALATKRADQISGFMVLLLVEIETTRILLS